MCLAVPAMIVACDGAGGAGADLQGNRVRISTVLVPDAKAGDWVLLHAGFAIQRLDGDEAADGFAVLEQVRSAAGGGRGGVP